MNDIFPRMLNDKEKKNHTSFSEYYLFELTLVIETIYQRLPGEEKMC